MSELTLFDAEPVSAPEQPRKAADRTKERTEWGVRHPPMFWCHAGVDIAASRKHAEGMAEGTSEIIERLTGRSGAATVVRRTVVTVTGPWEEPGA